MKGQEAQDQNECFGVLHKRSRPLHALLAHACACACACCTHATCHATAIDSASIGLACGATAAMARSAFCHGGALQHERALLHQAAAIRCNQAYVHLSCRISQHGSGKPSMCCCHCWTRATLAMNMITLLLPVYTPVGKASSTLTAVHAPKHPFIPVGYVINSSLGWSAALSVVCS